MAVACEQTALACGHVLRPQVSGINAEPRSDGLKLRCIGEEKSGEICMLDRRRARQGDVMRDARQQRAEARNPDVAALTHKQVITHQHAAEGRTGVEAEAGIGAAIPERPDGFQHRRFQFLRFVHHEDDTRAIAPERVARQQVKERIHTVRGRVRLDPILRQHGTDEGTDRAAIRGRHRDANYCSARGLDFRLDLVQGEGLADPRRSAQQRQTGTDQNLIRHHADH